MRIVVIGAGGVGGYFGARLARAGAQVTMLARGEHLAAIQRGGLHVRSTIEGEYVTKPDAVGDLRGVPHADLVLLAVKAFDTEAALENARTVVGTDTPVLTLQNGIDGPDRIETAFGPGHALGGAAYVFATIEAPGVIAHRFAGRIVFGEMDGRTTPRAERVREVFTQAGVPVELTPSIRRVLWEKYLFICAQAGMSALTRANTGVMRAVPETWRMYRLLLEELAALGAAAGAGLPADAVDRIMANAQELRPETTSSLHHDLLAGKRLELEALHGHAVRMGERHRIPTPMLFAVYAGLKPHLGGRQASETPGRHG
jgi:2-dehydropantoate 2-reductase